MSTTKFEVIRDGDPIESTRVSIVAQNNGHEQDNDPGVDDPEETQEDVRTESDASDADGMTNDDISEDKVLSFFEKKYDKKLNSIDDLFSEPEPRIIEKEMELPENVAAFNKFHRETGGSVSDFVNLNRDFDSMDDDQVLAEYYAAENPGWTKQDVAAEIADKFGYDPDDVEDRDKQRIERLKKTELSKARAALNSRKETYRAELASSSSYLSDEEKADLEAYKQYKSSLSDMQRDNDEKGNFFERETRKVFSSEFKGFEFKVGDKEVLFKPDEADNLINRQMNIGEWLESFKDEKGFIKDAKEFHKVVSIAMNHEAYLKHFYEQGMADAIKSLEAESKNLNMDPKHTSQPMTSGKGIRFEVIKEGGSNDHRVRISK